MCFNSAKTVNLSAMSCLDAEMQGSEVRDSYSSFHDGMETHLPTASIRSFSHTTQLMKLPTCIYRKGCENLIQLINGFEKLGNIKYK